MIRRPPRSTRFPSRRSSDLCRMVGLSLPHLTLLAVVCLLLFGGKNKISDLMGDLAKGIKSFKKGMSDDEATSAPQTAPDPLRTIDHQAAPPAAGKPVEVRKVG